MQVKDVMLVAAESSGRALKRRKTASGEEMTIVAPRPCYLERLPLELLTDVLSYSSTPKEILALARCSKLFCATLVGNPSALFIWRAARLRCVPAPIPDPTPNFTEASYAAFIFDGGKCDICGKPSKLMYHSFALRARLCRSKDCCKKWRTERLTPGHVIPPSAGAWTLCAEASEVYRNVTYPDARAYWPNISSRWLIDELKRNTADADAAVARDNEAFNTRVDQILKPRLQVIMNHATALYLWKEKYRGEYQRVDQANHELKGICASAGWKEWDLLNTPTCIALMRQHNNQLALLRTRDIERVIPAIAEEMDDALAARGRREGEANTRRKQEAVGEYYNRARQMKPPPLLPSLATFRRMPLPVSLQRFDGTAAKLEEELGDKHSVTARLLDDALTRWRAEVRKALTAKLRVPYHPLPSPRHGLLAVDRVNARFVCTKCKSVAPRYADDGCLDLMGVCLHECPQRSRKKRARQTWDVQQFAPAERAIKVLDQALTLCGLDASAAWSADVARSLPPRFLCCSCPGQIVMSFQQLIGHSERHEAMQISLLSEAEANALLVRPLEIGLCKLVVDKAFRARKEQAKKIYGCRHCAQSASETANMRQSGAQDGALAKTAAELQDTSAALTVDDTPMAVCIGPISGPLLAAPEEVISVGSVQVPLSHSSIQRKPGPEIEGVDSKNEGPLRAKKHKVSKDKLWDLNGVSSHVKEKHGFATLRDEDVYRVAV